MRSSGTHVTLLAFVKLRQRLNPLAFSVALIAVTALCLLCLLSRCPPQSSSFGTTLSEESQLKSRCCKLTVPQLGLAASARHFVASANCATSSPGAQETGRGPVSRSPKEPSAPEQRVSREPLEGLGPLTWNPPLSGALRLWLGLRRPAEVQRPRWATVEARQQQRIPPDSAGQALLEQAGMHSWDGGTKPAWPALGSEQVLLRPGSATGRYRSVLGDPGMQSQHLRMAVEGWNFCNRAGPAQTPAERALESPRWADCADLVCGDLPDPEALADHCHVSQRVSEADNALRPGDPFPRASPPSVQNHVSSWNLSDPDLYAVAKEHYLAKLCQVTGESQDERREAGGDEEGLGSRAGSSSRGPSWEEGPWHFWMIMLKNGNFDPAFGFCEETGRRASWPSGPAQKEAAGLGKKGAPGGEPQVEEGSGGLASQKTEPHTDEGGDSRLASEVDASAPREEGDPLGSPRARVSMPPRSFRVLRVSKKGPREGVLAVAVRGAQSQPQSWHGGSAFPCFGVGCMNQPRVWHHWSEPHLSPSPQNASNAQEVMWGLRGGFYGTYDLDVTSTNDLAADDVPHGPPQPIQDSRLFDSERNRGARGREEARPFASHDANSSGAVPRPRAAAGPVKESMDGSSSSRLLPGGWSEGGASQRSSFSVEWHKSTETGSWEVRHRLAVSSKYPWLMLYLRADATAGSSGGYPWDTRGIMKKVPVSPNFRVRLSLDVLHSGGAQSQFYLVDIGGCWKNSGQPCDGDTSTDVTRYSEMILNPSTTSWCSPSQLALCPPFHTRLDGSVVPRTDSLNFPYGAYHLYCAPSNAMQPVEPSVVCDPWSNPQPQELLQLLPHMEWAPHGLPGEKGEGWLGDPRSWDLDMGALSARLYFYQDPGTPPATRVWPSVDVGTEVYISATPDVAEWIVSDFDVLVMDPDERESMNQI